jgi:hypothetical protein
MYFSLLNISLKMAKKRLKHVGGLPHVYTLLYQVIVQLIYIYMVKCIAV